MLLFHQTSTWGTKPRFRSRRLSDGEQVTSAITSSRHDEETARCHGYQRNPLPLSTPSKNRTTVKVRYKLQRRLAATALLGLAPVRSGPVHLPPTTGSISALPQDDLGVANGKVAST
jgi:hypothetical protein